MRSVFSSTAGRQRGADMFLKAPGCEHGWFLNTLTKAVLLDQITTEKNLSDLPMVSRRGQIN